MLLTFGPWFLLFSELLASCRQRTQNKTAWKCNFKFLALSSGAQHIRLLNTKYASSSFMVKITLSSSHSIGHFQTFLEILILIEYCQQVSTSSERWSPKYAVLFIWSSHCKEGKGHHLPVIVLCAINPVVGVEGDLLTLHVPLAHSALQAPVMEHLLIN